MGGSGTRANTTSERGTRLGVGAEARAGVAAEAEAGAGTDTRANTHERTGMGRGGKRDITAVTTETGTNTDGTLIMKNTGETRETVTHELHAQPRYTHSKTLTRHVLFVFYCIVRSYLYHLKNAFYECNFTFLVVHSLV